jgi:hypothetical protein
LTNSASYLNHTKWKPHYLYIYILLEILNTQQICCPDEYCTFKCCGFFSLVMTVNSCFFLKMSFIVITIHTSVIFVKKNQRLMYSIGFIYFEFGIKDRDGKTILKILKRWSDAVNRKLTDTSQNKKDNRTNKDPQNSTYKAKDWATRTSTKYKRRTQVLRKGK